VINNNDILVFDFDFDKQCLLDYWNEHKQHSMPYTDKRFGKYAMNNWRIVTNIELAYADTLARHFNINAVPKFYILHANTTLLPHIDQDTTCSINFLLSGNPAPVNFGKNEYYYTTALLNTSIKHSVDNSTEDRILFKLSVKDESYNDVKQKILNTLSRS
jgi:hypothetical protein